MFHHSHHTQRGFLIRILLALLVVIVTSSVAEVVAPARESVLPTAPLPHAATVRKTAPVLRKKKTPPVVTASVKEPALLAVVTHPDIEHRHRILADQILRLLPSACRDHLQNFYVRYSAGTQRALGGKTTIILTGASDLPDTEFISLITHECGHVIHGNLTGSSTAPSSIFRDGGQVFYADSTFVSFATISWSNERVLKKTAQKQDFVSGYAVTDAFEDFAETFNAYELHENYFEQRAEHNPVLTQKLAWMRANFPKSSSFSLSLAQDAFPWDMTKLSYSLQTPVAGRN